MQRFRHWQDRGRVINEMFQTYSRRWNQPDQGEFSLHKSAWFMFSHTPRIWEGQELDFCITHMSEIISELCDSKKMSNLYLQPQIYIIDDNYSDNRMYIYYIRKNLVPLKSSLPIIWQIKKMDALPLPHFLT